MKILIKNGSSVPIYEQIKTEIKQNIIDGSMKADEQLPSVRRLSSQLKISILTVKKAYDELEEEGFIVTKQGLGSFVSADNQELKREEKQKELEEHLLEACRLSKHLELERGELFALFKYIYEEDIDGK